MSFLKNLFGGGKKQEEKQVIDNPVIDTFQKDFNDAIFRYIGGNSTDVQLKLYNDKKELLTYEEAFPDIFKQWKEIQSVWDKRSLIFGALDKIMGNQLSLPQVIERFVIDRYSERAMNIAKENAGEEELKSSEYWAAVALAETILYKYANAEESANKSLAIDPNNRKAQTILADVFHLTNRHDKAHEMYSNLLKTSSLSSRLEKNNEVSLIEIVGYKYQILNSPIYAINMLKGTKDADIETWDWIAGEFYYSPHFRAQHAYYLIEQGEHLKGMSKLISLSQEMPWYKEGVTNARSVIRQLNMDDIVAEEVIRLDDIIKQNNW